MTRAPLHAAVLTGIALALSLSMASPRVAHAQDKSGSAETAKKVEEISGKAVALYRDKDYLGAIELFKKAYAIQPVPNLLYNIARCYEKADKYEEAIEYYKKFTVAPDVDSKSREDSLQRIDALQEAQAAKKQLNKPKGPRGPVVTTPPPAPDRTLGYVLLGTGGLALAGGAVMGVMANGKQADFEAAGTTPDERRTIRDSGKNFALAADGLYVVGAGLAIAGVYFAATAKAPRNESTTSGSGQDRDASSQTLVAPWFSTTGGGVTMQFGF